MLQPFCTSRCYFMTAKSTICAMMLLSVFVRETSSIHIIYVNPAINRRLDVTPRDVITAGSTLKCSAMCRLTSWCASANLSPDRSTCQLLSEEVSDETSLESVDGWSYLRKFILNKNSLDFRNKH